MAKNIKKLFALVLAVSMAMSLSVNAFATDGGDAIIEEMVEELPEIVEEEPANEPEAEPEITGAAKIGDEGFDTLADAITAANADAETEESVVIELLDDITVDAGLAINRDITLCGEFTITRGTAKTLFTVKAGKTLTLDGGLIIDGGNDWTFDEDGYYANMEDCLTLSTGAKNTYTYPEEGGIVATAAMIVIKGEVDMYDATIQNNWGSPLFSIPANAVLTMNDGALIQHIRSGDGGAVVGQITGTWNMDGGKVDDIHGHNTNGGVADLRGGTVNINDGEISNVRTLGLKSNGNGILFQVYGESSKLNINGGWIHDNASFSPGNGWGAVVYLNRGGDFTMTDGVIEDTMSDICTAFVSNQETSVELLGGTIEVNTDTHPTRFESLFLGKVTIGDDMNIVGEDGARFIMLGDDTYTLEINGEVTGDGTMWLMNSAPVTGEGTVTSDVLVKTYSYYPAADVILAGADWNCLITVDSVGSDATLTVQPGANVTDGLVRVLESVDSGNYLNGEESAAAQASAYVEEDGANVTSPVLYYHRLTADQKSDIVVTFDYNGGLDAQNWSGCQLTSAEAFAPVSPQPMLEGYVLAGWNYAEDNDPECLTMDGDEAYNGETITESVRLIAQWKSLAPDTYTVTYMHGDEVLQEYDGLFEGDKIPGFKGKKPVVSGKKFDEWELIEGEANGKRIGTTDLVFNATFTRTSNITPSNPDVEIIDDEIPLAEIPSVFGDDHYAYIIGRDDGLVHPEANITRAEVATIFFRLLAEEVRTTVMTGENDFTDVEQGQWYNHAVSTLASMGIIYGKGDGTYFAPNDYITRAEFAAIAARFDPIGMSEGAFFSDISGHWAEREIIIAANNGWVEGYNGLFRPDDYITRAEAMTLVNRVLHRLPETEEDLLDEMIVWPDNMDVYAWYYLAIQEATNSHDYVRKTDPIYESWTQFRAPYDWSLLEN